MHHNNITESYSALYLICNKPSPYPLLSLIFNKLNIHIYGNYITDTWEMKTKRGLLDVTIET